MLIATTKFYLGNSILKCIIPTPPHPHERKFWHYQEANGALIRQTLHRFSWKKVLPNFQVNVFNWNILNIPKKNIDHETIVSNKKDVLWFKSFSYLFQECIWLLEAFRKNRNNVEISLYRSTLQSKTTETVE